MSLSDIEQFHAARTTAGNHAYIQKLLFAKQQLGLSPKRVYYPYSGTDQSVAIAFGESIVTHIDRESSYIHVLRANHRRAFCRDVYTYRPKQKQDVIVLMNPDMVHRSITSVLQKDGFVLCDHAYESAETLVTHPELQCVGVVVYHENRPTYVTTGLLDFWSPVVIDAEYRSADKSNRLRAFLKKYAGVTQNFTRAHQALLDLAHERTVAYYQGVFPQKTSREMEEIYEKGDAAYLDPPNPNTIVPRIPYKRSASLYVFQLTAQT